MALSLQVSSAVQAGAGSVPATLVGTAAEGSSQSSVDFTFAALMQGFTPGTQTALSGTAVQGPHDAAAQDGYTSVSSVAHDARLRGRRADSEAFDPTALQAFATPPLAAPAQPQPMPSDAQALQDTSSADQADSIEGLGLPFTNNTNTLAISTLAQSESRTDIKPSASVAEPHQLKTVALSSLSSALGGTVPLTTAAFFGEVSDGLPSLSQAPSGSTYGAITPEQASSDATPNSSRTAPQTAAPTVKLVTNSVEQTSPAASTQTHSSTQQAATAPLGTQSSVSFVSAQTVGSALTTHPVKQSTANEMSFSVQGLQPTPTLSGAATFTVEVEQPTAVAHVRMSLTGAATTLANAPAQDNSGAASSSLSGSVLPITLTTSSASSTASDDASSQSQSNAGDQGAADRRTSQSIRSTDTAALDSGTRFGMNGWLANSQQHGLPTKEHPEQMTSLLSSGAAAQMNFDRVATDSANRRLTNAMRADMTFGVQTESFGRVNVQTSVRGDQLLSQISLEHANLHASALAAHMPVLEAKLNERYNLNASVTVRPDTGSAAGQQQSPSRDESGRHADTAAIAKSTAGLRAVSTAIGAHQPLAASVMPTDTERLDVTI